ncbi:MAG: response regulator [Lachnospiraceae bacterium]|nr:response regulator [Lachnospiraceae bacterium]
MFDLTRNIDFDMAGMLIYVFLFLASLRIYSSKDRSSMHFYNILLVGFFTGIADILVVVGETYSYALPAYFSKIFYFLFLSGTALSTYFVYKYVRSYQKDDQGTLNSPMDIFALALAGGLMVLGLVNIFTDILIRLDENGAYVRGNLEQLVYLLPMVIFVLILISLFTHKEDYTRRQLISILALIGMVSFFSIMQYMNDDKILFTVFGTSVSLMFMLTSLETPDYKKLMEVLKEQETTKQEALKAKELADRLRQEADSARIAAEAASNESQEAKKIAQQSQKLAEDAKEAAIRANQSKSSFLARMSHEIRTPMNAVLGLNELIAKESTQKTIVEYANDAKKASENLLNIINDILDFSKIESGKLELVETEYSFKDIINEEYTLFSFKAKERNLKLVFDIDPNIPSVLFGDDIRLKQILTNLLSNAIKYTESGTVTLKVTLEGRGRSSAVVKYVVKDTGIGIKEEDIGKLYDAFERIEEKRNRNIEGTGLGINIVVQLLTMMGSKLMIDSVYGLGSQFSFSLRQTMIDSTPVGEISDDQAEKKTTGHGQKLIYAPEARVLVVDDNNMNLKVFAGLVKDTGIKVDTALSGSEALGYTLKNKYDLIFMDHLMPGMDGIETRRAIISQEDGINKDTIQIVLTANAIKGAMEEYLSYGFADTVFKPVKQGELNDVLWKYLPDRLIENA